MTDTPTPEPTEKPKNVIEALAAVMRDMPGVGRDERSEQGYAYRGIEAITRHAQHLLGKYGLVFVPRVLSRQVKDFTINNRPWTEDQAEVVYSIYGPGGIEDRIEVGPLIGLGRDNSDKGMNKAMTQAFKYALIQTLCQPTGTMVRIPVRGAVRQWGERAGWTEVPIESVQPGDRVVSWQWNPAVVLASGRIVTAVRTRPYDGPLVTAQTGISLSRYTPDHRCITRLGRLADGNHVVYLMRRGDQYRIGRCTWLRPSAPSKTSDHYGVIERASAQGADAVWVLSAHETAEESSLHEALTATRFGLPDVMFRVVAPGRSRFDLDEFWSKVGTNGQQAAACLAAFGLLPNGPLLRRPAMASESWLPLDGVAAANLRSGMLVGVPGEFDPSIRRLRMRWEAVTIGRDYYSGLVHSLDVEGEHTYIADGIGTHNCIGDGKDDPDADKAHEADARQTPPDPLTKARDQLFDDIRALTAEGREKVRAYCDEHSIPRAPGRMDADQLQAVSSVVDAIYIAATQDEAAEAPQSAPEPSQTAETGNHPTPAPTEPPATPPDAVDGLQAAIDTVAGMKIAEISNELELRNLSTSGNAAARAQRLAQALVDGPVPAA